MSDGVTQALTAITPPRSPEPVIVRPARPDEAEMILTKWVNSYYKSPFGEQFYCPIKRSGVGIFQRAWTPTVASLISRSSAVCLCPADSPEATVYGWMVWEPAYKLHMNKVETKVVPLLHYAHVRGSLRRLGYMGTMMAPLGMDFAASHSTSAFVGMVRHFREENGLLAGRTCQMCTAPLVKTPDVDPTLWLYKCSRPAQATRPKCPTQFRRPKDYTPIPRPVITVDLTLV